MQCREIRLLSLLTTFNNIMSLKRWVFVNVLGLLFDCHKQFSDGPDDICYNKRRPFLRLKSNQS